MRSHILPGGDSGRRLLITLAAVATLVVPVLALPGAEAAPTPSVRSVQQRVTVLRSEAEVATERYNDARVKLASVNVRLRAARTKLRQQRVEVAKARSEVGQVAAETYRRGQLSALDVILGDDPDAVLAQNGYLPTLGRRQTAAMQRLRQQQAVLVGTEADIEAQQHRATRTTRSMKADRTTVLQQLAQAKALLATLQASQRRAIARANLLVSNAGVPSGADATFCRSMAGQASSPGAKAALTFACNQLGDPYVWAAAGPDTFDCSGLTMRAWQAGGVTLPHSSSMQSGYGTRVGLGQLRPGDLLFFFTPIHHVGIYLGNGLMVHAPHTGDVVRIAGIFTTPSAAVRL